jgi:hypothetical protein
MQLPIRTISILIFVVVISFKNVASVTYPNNIAVGDTSEKAVKKAANRIANRASLYSTILPGMGQAYNKKYWKVPIIYVALGAFGYFIVKDNNDVRQYHKELVYRYNNNLTPDPSSNIPNNRNYSVEDINTLRIDTKKYLDFFIIGASLVYILNIIDANVDGHFRTFDMSDKLSLTVKPKTSFCVQNPKALNVGVSLTLNFK